MLALRESLSSAGSLFNASNLFLSAEINCSFTSGIISLQESNNFFSLSRSLHSTRWWSLLTSAPLTALMSIIDFLYFRLMAMWSIWLLVLASGDTQVSLCIVLCQNTVPSITRPFSEHKSANRWPLSFLTPTPSFPIQVSYPVFSDPTLAFITPISITISCRGV